MKSFFFILAFLINFLSLDTFGAIVTCRSLGYSSNGTATLPFNGPPLPLGETAFNYGQATLWCVGSSQKAGFVTPQLLGSSDFSIIGTTNCIGVFDAGSCCRANLSFTPTKEGQQSAAVFQEEIVMSGGNVVSRGMRCYDILGSAATSSEQYKLKFSIFDLKGNQIGSTSDELNPLEQDVERVPLLIIEELLKCLA